MGIGDSLVKIEYPSIMACLEEIILERVAEIIRSLHPLPHPVAFLGLMATLLAGCVTTHTAMKPPAQPAASREACAPEAALPKEWTTPGSIVLFGEIHGVKELPSFFGEAVCSAAQSGVPVAVGLEIPVSEQPSIDSFLRSSEQPSDVELLLKGPFWTRKDQDGRSSQARVELLERIRRLRAAGLPVRVFLFDINEGENLDGREKSMALNISNQTRSHASELTLVLVGEVHAWKTKGTPWDEDFLTMGWHLADSGLRVYSLGRSTPDGAAWMCSKEMREDSPMSCGPHATHAFQPLASGRTHGIELLSEPSSRGNDGLYAVPTLTESPPAVVVLRAGQ